MMVHDVGSRCGIVRGFYLCGWRIGEKSLHAESVFFPFDACDQ
jgi:hypothetical protein